MGMLLQTGEDIDIYNDIYNDVHTSKTVNTPIIYI